MPNTTGPVTVTLSGSAVFTSASSYFCSVTDANGPRAWLVTKTGKTFTLQTQGSSSKHDVLSYICIGS